MDLMITIQKGVDDIKFNTSLLLMTTNQLGSYTLFHL